jgi:hypothetical protein
VPAGDGVFKSHAARSVPWDVSDEVLRLFFSSRDADDRMLPTYIDVSRDDPATVLEVNRAPLAELGAAGAFDDCGITLACLVRRPDRIYAYYTGWKRRRVVPFELSVGLLSWVPERSRFERLYQGPILAQDRNHPFLVAGPFVMYDDDRFKMWYCSGTGWTVGADRAEPRYTVFYSESDDGIAWRPMGKPVIEYRYAGEVISAPWVIRGREKYHMWYSTRGHESAEAKRYVIGYAESPDGIRWTRLDEYAGIARSGTGWDSEMICYPSFWSQGETLYMFYSGNDVGKGGLGYAVAQNVLG